MKPTFDIWGIQSYRRPVPWLLILQYAGGVALLLVMLILIVMGITVLPTLEGVS